MPGVKIELKYSTTDNFFGKDVYGDHVRCYLQPEVAEVTMRPENTIELAGDDAARMQKLLDLLADLDDVQNVYHNAEIEA